MEVRIAPYEAPSGPDSVENYRTTSRAPIFGYYFKNGALTVLARGSRLAYTASQTLWLRGRISSSDAHVQCVDFRVFRGA